MPRLPRIHTRPYALVEVVNRTIQGRYLLKPGPRMNALIVGALAKAQQKYGARIHSGAFASNHWHLMISSDSVKTQADFLRDVTRKLSIESGRLYDWDDTIFPKRYHSAEISDEPEAQIARLKYHLSHGCKENLVHSPLDWPGVSFAESLVTGEPLKGIWIDRTAYHSARGRGEDVSLEDFTEHLEMSLAPLPCWRHLDATAHRQQIVDILRSIEAETAARHASDQTGPLGAEVVLSVDPHFQPNKLKPSPQPYVHAYSAKVWQEMRLAFSYIVAAYREAAERLRSGDLRAVFPENTFRPALPFVDRARRVSAPATPDLLEPG